jgi:hypothetical protein
LISIAFAVTILIVLVLVLVMDDQITVEVTFNERGYLARLPQTITALSLQSLRQRAAIALGVGVERIKLRLDKTARRQRDQRRSGGAARASDTSGQSPAG